MHVCCSKKLQYLKPELITQELCMIAIQQSVFAIFYVPLEFQTKELCKFVVQNSDDYALRFIKQNIIKSFDIEYCSKSN